MASIGMYKKTVISSLQRSNMLRIVINSSKLLPVVQKLMRDPDAFFRSVPLLSY